MKGISSSKRAFVSQDEEYLYEDNPRLALTTLVSIRIPYTRYPGAISMTAFQSSLGKKKTSQLQKTGPLPLEFPMTLVTHDFMDAWASKKYKKGIFSNAGYWLDLQAFYETRSVRDLFTLAGTTNKSHLFLLPFLRDGAVPPAFLRRCKVWRTPLYGYFPLYFQLSTKPSYPAFLAEELPSLSRDDIERGLRRLTEDLDRLFDEAPPLRHGLVVYRGIKTFEKKETWIDPAFVSTTLHPLHAFRYKNPTNPCCVQRLRVPPSVKVLFLEGMSNFPGEWEVLLPRNLRFRVKKETTLQVLATEEDWASPVPGRFQTVRFQEVVVVS
jgi:hypothetical protein